MFLPTLGTVVVLTVIVALFAWRLHNLRPQRASRVSLAGRSLHHLSHDRDGPLHIDRIVALQCATTRQEPHGGGILSQVGSHIAPALRRALDAAARIRWFGIRLKAGRDREETATPMRDALDRVPVAIVGFNERTEIAFANEQARALFGYGGDAMIGASERLLFPECPASVTYSVPAQAVSSAPPPGQTMQAMVAKRSDGSEFPADVLTSACRIDGAPTRLAVIVDRSERNELQRNRQELAHLSRISALGELAGSLAHELNQPLTAILSNAQAVQHFIEADSINLPEVREILKDIVADNCRAGEIIRKMRALVRRGDVELQPLDVGGVVRDVVLLVHSDAVLRGITTTLDIDDELRAVRGDRVQLQQVVLNLLLNGFDAVHDEVAAYRVVAVRVWAEPDGTIRIRVSDCGHGLTVDQLDKIFKPFFTSKPHGLGLGLSISQTIVAAHGGRLWAENNADRGASFHVSLPAEGRAESNRARRQP
ncbi:ATP-binding protein [Burkholderia sp. S-53]|uniref:ATP-binding protein n=1 Tax=Burkholderia sp. S-53 TaxID=2906514 RepID=UPI0021D257CB|nr:ATP-binding protein [Burkholderia sp. S-53]UXU85288.1 ATP-binding protein [Burkholderia sp. S-53]